MHIVALNWRDLANPLGGGAEVHLEEILRYLGHQGHRCTLVTSRFPGAKALEDADGYRIVRGGGELTFNLAVPSLYRRLVAADPPDIVLDDINKIPFYSPLWARAPVLAVIPHLMGTTVFQEVNPLLAAAVYAAEQPVRWVYRRCHFEVISESTRDDLVARGYPAERIAVVHCGIDRARYRPDPAVPKTATPTLVYVGRIKRYKAVDHAIRALPIVRRRFADATLTIVGDGDGLPGLRALAAELGLVNAVRFAGFLPHAEKIRLLQSAHAVVNPSVKEGWGLTNVEANACGTVCVAADSPGIRDSVRDGETGLLYPWGNIDALAGRVVDILASPARRAAMEQAALAWAASLTWERCGAETLRVIDRILGTNGRGA
ncbi:MAG: glycosyltransferase family 4 protein [Candidatus Binatia bacterium]